jgi:hypothetical protein
MEMQKNALIARVSKGSNMNQIYLPKNTGGIRIMPGDYVAVNILAGYISEKQSFKPYFYGLKELEPIKLKIIKEIFGIIIKFSEKTNIIITGSFLEKGFNFNDVDILILDKEINIIAIESEIISQIGLKAHIISLSKEELTSGLASDPLYQTMISRCISKNRLIFNYKPFINPKILDLHLLKSKTLIDNFEILNGREKYYLTFNLISILLFLKKGKITKELVEKTIKEEFDLKNKQEVKENLIGKEFLAKYKKIYDKTFDWVMKKLKEAKNSQDEPKSK